MKNFINILFLLLIISSSLTSCMEDVGDFTVQGEAITTFELSTPENNDSITINTEVPDETVVFQWSAAESGLGSAISYTILFDTPDGDFSNPIWSKVADDSGSTNASTITFSELLQLYSQIISNGDTWLKWNVKATNGSPNIKMAQLARNLKLKTSSEGISNFSLLSPINNSILLFDGSKDTEAVTFDWEDAETTGDGLTYQVYIDDIDGDFSSPLLVLDADDNGTSSQLTMTNGEWKALLDQNEIEAGAYRWTVKAMGTDFEWMKETFNLYIEFANWIQLFYVVGDYNGWDNSDNATYIISTETSNGMAEGYVYLKQGGIKLVTDHSWDDAHTFGDDGSGGLTNPGGNIPVAEDGYYRIQASLSAMTYSLTKTVWGVIGDASPGGWSNQTNMTYDSESQTFQLAIHLTAGGSFKFRGTSDWNINYGSTAADGKTLDAGGSNIAVEIEDDYAVTLDLSHPNEYTYSANRWGVVGSATPDPTWGSDFNMTWDDQNNVFTITLDMTAGEFKFRANDTWDVNYGGDLDALTAGGSNIAIAEAGNYTITFDPWMLKTTVTKN